jgi:tetratricopeptide (TPR) repeat protein
MIPHMRQPVRILLALACLLVVASRAEAQRPGVGQVSFPNSGAAAAQEDFLTGLAQLHNFEYGSAAEFFRKAQQADPNFAMAYWGEAMTHTHPIWMEQNAQAARDVLARLGASPAARLAKAKTEREKDYLRAIDVLYGDGDKQARDIRYAEAMENIRRKYPDDVDAAAFAALALLGTAHAGRDFGIYMRAAATLEPWFPSHPKHPGIAHYLIHSYDDPIHAPLGLRAAREYSKIAPSAAHAQHMTSHIFVAVGMWDDVVAANETAVKLSGGATTPGRPPAPCGHYPSWLMYGYLQQGRVTVARDMVKACHAAGGASAGMRTRYLIDTEEWTGEIASLTVKAGPPASAFTLAFTEAFGAVRRGDLTAARSAFAKMQEARKTIEAAAAKTADPAHAGMPGMAMPAAGAYDAGALGRVRILHDEIAALLKHKEGASRDAVAMLRSAAALEDTLPFEFGPPFIDKPAYELLGDVLLEMNQPKDARAAFEKALSRTPERTQALTGLMKAAAQSGDSKTEGETRARLQAIWHKADPKR